MNKGLLLLDKIPVYCGDCPCSDLFIDSDDDICGVNYRHIGNRNSKPNWCPIKSIPEKLNHWPYYPGSSDSEYENGYTNGFNTCLDMILEEESENE